MTDQLFDDSFEEHLKSHQPASPAISQSHVMFESGRLFEQNLNQHSARQLQTWRAFGICGFLIAAISLTGYLPFFTSSDSVASRSDSIVSERSAGSPQQSTAGSNNDSQAINDSSAAVDGAANSNQRSVQPAFFQNWLPIKHSNGNSELSNHYYNIAQGVDGLPETFILATPLSDDSTDYPTRFFRLINNEF